MIVVTPRGMERERVSESAFKQFVGESLRGLGAPPAEKDLREVPRLAPDRRDQPARRAAQGRGRGLGAAGRARQGRGFFERSKYLLSSTTLLLLRGKALSLSVYTQYDDPADLEWIRATTARWIDELKRLNSPR